MQVPHYRRQFLILPGNPRCPLCASSSHVVRHLTTIKKLVCYSQVSIRPDNYLHPVYQGARRGYPLSMSQILGGAWRPDKKTAVYKSLMIICHSW